MSEVLLLLDEACGLWRLSLREVARKNEELWPSFFLHSSRSITGNNNVPLHMQPFPLHFTVLFAYIYTCFTCCLKVFCWYLAETPSSTQSLFQELEDTEQYRIRQEWSWATGFEYKCWLYLMSLKGHSTPPSPPIPLASQQHCAED